MDPPVVSVPVTEAQLKALEALAEYVRAQKENIREILNRAMEHRARCETEERPLEEYTQALDDQERAEHLDQGLAALDGVIISARVATEGE